MRKNCNVGGQAVIEGVMMRGSKCTATAVRLEDGSIIVNKEEYVPYTKRHNILNIPILRGFITLIESLIIGIKTLNYSASFFEDEEQQSKFEKWLNNKFKEKATNIILGFSLILSLFFSVLIFFVLPTFITNLFSKSTDNVIVLNLLEGLIRVIIFLLYLVIITKMEDIYRVFQYHGAEHKTIFCYENEDKLTPESCSKYGRLHPRCGTNFIFLVFIISIILFSLIPWNSLLERVIYRILLLPIVSGITYELIKWLGKNNNFISRAIAFPGLCLQKLTTKEPDLQQLEVAIAALKASEGINDDDAICQEVLE
jgi:uncharacterized protein YqhQ